MKTMTDRLISRRNFEVMGNATLWMLVFCAYVAPDVKCTPFYKGSCVVLYILLFSLPLMAFLILIKHRWSIKTVVKRLTYYQSKLSFWDVYNLMPFVLMFPFVFGSEEIKEVVQFMLVPLIVFPNVVKTMIFK